MAGVQLSRADAEGGRLPPMCMECGAPATTEVTKKYSTDQVPLVDPFPAFLFPILFPIWLFLAVAKLVSWSSAKRMAVRTPLCRKHAHRWFTSSPLEAKSITDETIVLAGVSEEFAGAWTRQGVADRSNDGDRVKVRCPSCRSLNDETAKFCDQCGAVL